MRTQRNLHRAISLASALIVAALLTGCSVLPFELPFSGVIQPTISPASQSGTRQVTREISFGGKTVRLGVPVDQAVYQGARDARKTAIVFGRQDVAEWVPDYYRAFIDEKHQDTFYSSLASALDQVQDSERLDADRYVELVIALVQQLEYRTDPQDLSPKFPVETFGDGYGDCDDKALLAAALLSRKGYDVAILVFSTEKHVALGIRAPGLDYKGTGYAYVESTNDALPGIAPEQLEGGITLESTPQVVKISDGTTTYGAGTQITYITGRLENLRAAQDRLSAQIKDAQAQLDTLKSQLDAERAQLSSNSDPASLRAAVDAFNEKVTAYNTLARSTRELVGRFNALVDAENYVVDHLMDRPLVYQRLKRLPL